MLNEIRLTDDQLELLDGVLDDYQVCVDEDGDEGDYTDGDRAEYAAIRKAVRSPGKETAAVAGEASATLTLVLDATDRSDDDYSDEALEDGEGELTPRVEKLGEFLQLLSDAELDALSAMICDLRR